MKETLRNGSCLPVRILSDGRGERSTASPTPSRRSQILTMYVVFPPPVLNSDVRPRSGDSSPILSQLIRQCWDKDPTMRPNFGAVEIILKNGMAAAANARHVCNALVSTVGKLVKDVQSLYILERESSMEKLRDMLDPGQDLYEVKDVQEAVRLAGGIKCVVEVLDVEAMSARLPPGHGGALALRESQRLAAEVLGNACVGNAHCQEEAGICGAPRALVKMILKTDTAIACRAATRALMVVSENHVRNCKQATNHGGYTALLALAMRCAPPLPPALETTDCYESVTKDNEGIEAADASYIPGLQQDQDDTDERDGKAVREHATSPLSAALPEVPSRTDAAKDLRGQMKALLLGSDVLSDSLAGGSVLEDDLDVEASSVVNMDSFADAEAILNATHSVLDVSTPTVPAYEYPSYTSGIQNPKTPGGSKSSLFFDTSSPTPQELRRKEAESGSDAWYAEQLLKTAAKNLPRMEADFTELLLQTILAICDSADEMKAEVARQGLSVLSLYFFHDSDVVQTLASRVVLMVSAGNEASASESLCIVPPRILVELLQKNGSASDAAVLFQEALHLAATQASHRPQQLQAFRGSGCMNYVLDRLLDPVEPAERKTMMIDTLVSILEVESQAVISKSSAPSVLLSLLKEGSDPVHWVVACRGLRSILPVLSPPLRSDAAVGIIRRISEIRPLAEEQQIAVLELLSECCGASEQAKSAMLDGDVFTELARIGCGGASALQGSCLRCMSRVWDQCSSSLGQTLRRHKVVPLLVDVVQDDKADTQAVTTAAEALWLAMEQCLECRADFKEARGITALLHRLDSGDRRMRVYAAATIRTACINSPSNREAVYADDGIRRLLSYVGLEMTQIIQEALDGGIDIADKWIGVEHALGALNNACCGCRNNIQKLHSNCGMALLIRLLDHAAGPKVREFAALAIVNACSGSSPDSGYQWQAEACNKLKSLSEDATATENARKYASGALKILRGRP